MTHLLEQTIAAVDANLPWILPSLETVESLFPLSLRLLVAVGLGLSLAWVRQRHDDGAMRVSVKSF